MGNKRLKKGTVSIIIPMYNAEKFIEECIRSCLSQNYPKIEIIVVDDGSTDGSKKRLSLYLKKVQYFYQKNAGGSSARNTGLSLASGEFVYFLDADDVIFPDTISTLVGAMQKNNCGIGIGAFQEINEQGKVFGFRSAFENDYLVLKDGHDFGRLFTVYPNPSTKLFRMKIIRDNSLRFDDLRLAQDLNFFFKYLICCRAAVFIKKPVYKYRVTKGTISTSYDDRILDIVKSFDGVMSFAKKKKYPLSDISNVKIMHLYMQIKKTFFIKIKAPRRYIYSALIREFNNTKDNKSAVTYKYIKKYVAMLRLLKVFAKVCTSSFAHRVAMWYKRVKKQ